MTEGSQNTISYALLTLGVLLLALAGYAGYELYPRFDLPAASGVSLLALAATAGIASFFSPCSFPLLVTMLARQSGSEEGATSFRRVMLFALALSFGATAFLTLLGLGIAVGAGSIFKQVTFTSFVGRALRIVIGVLLILLGLIQIGRLPLSFHNIVAKAGRPLWRTEARVSLGHPLAGAALYGFLYILAGFG